MTAMKKMFYTLLVVLSAAACGGRGDRAETDIRDMEWTKTDPMDLAMKPVAAFAQDWMALGVKSKDGINAMTVAWGQVGELWGRPVATVFVSKDRYTKHMLDEAGQFTLSAFPQTPGSRQILTYIGSHSLSDEPDKLENAGLTVELSDAGNPLFKEADLAIECKVIYSEEFKPELLPEAVKPMYERMGLHTFYIGEITGVYQKKSVGVPVSVVDEPVAE